MKRLYELFPEFHRARDREAGRVLERLCDAIDDELQATRDRIGEAWEGWFVETARLSRLPEIAELVGVAIPAGAAQPHHRALVGNAVAHRRAKGTAAALEGMARDATGWGVRLLELQSSLSATAAVEVGARAQGSEHVTRSVDIRGIGRGAEGGSNLREIGVQVARHLACPVEHAPLTPVGRPGCFRLHPLGVDTPLMARRGFVRVPDVAEVRARPSDVLRLWWSGRAVEDAAVEVADLDDWSQPGPHVEGVLGGPVALSGGGPERPAVRIQIGDGRPRVARLPRWPTDAEEAARLLERASSRGDDRPGLSVFAVDRRLLLVAPGSEAIRVTAHDDHPGFLAVAGLDRLERAHALLGDRVAASHPGGALDLDGDPGEDGPPKVAAWSDGVADAVTVLRRVVTPLGWRVGASDDRLVIVLPDAARGVVLRGPVARALGLDVRVLLDPARGRVRFPAGVDASDVRADWSFALPGPLGAGPFTREVLAPTDQAAEVCADFGPGAGPGRFRTLGEALEAWTDRRRDHHIRIVDSAHHAWPDRVAPGGGRLVIEVDEGEAPTLVGAPEIDLDGGSVDIRGAWVRGGLHVSGRGALRLAWCTVSGPVHTEGGRLDLQVESSVLGGLFLTEQTYVAARRAVLGQRDGASVVGAGQSPGPVVELVACTVLGEARVSAIPAAQETLFLGPLSVQRRHEGVLHHCALAAGSRAPHQDACVPFEPASAPELVSTVLGQVGFAQLVGTDTLHHFMASHGGESGVWGDLLQHARVAALRGVIDEFLPVGWSAAVSFEN